MEEEVVVLPIKELNRNDFHECLKPVLASQFSVPEGDFTFPMKERYEKVRTGHASDALEVLTQLLSKTGMPRWPTNRIEM